MFSMSLWKRRLVDEVVRTLILDIAFLVTINNQNIFVPIFIVVRQLSNVSRSFKNWQGLEEVMRLSTLLYSVQHTKLRNAKLCSIPLIQELKAGEDMNDVDIRLRKGILQQFRICFRKGENGSFSPKFRYQGWILVQCRQRALNIMVGLPPNGASNQGVLANTSEGFAFCFTSHLDHRRIKLRIITGFRGRKLV